MSVLNCFSFGILQVLTELTVMISSYRCLTLVMCK